jgi:GT2 family glycosyltransferase
VKVSLIICTYKRANPLLELLQSVALQSLYPDEILIIDGSPDDATKDMIARNNFEKVIYHKVEPENRGLTKQRNYGIGKVNNQSQVVCFLDDDTILKPNYFEELVKAYHNFPEALGVGGYIDNEVVWTKVSESYAPKIDEFYFDGWKRKDGSRFVWRKRLGLDADCPPGFLPEFSHGRSISFLPPTNKIYEVEQLMGGVSSFKKSVFDELQFSTYFEGYGLYEDADFTLRLSKLGKLYVNTAACLGHFHDPSGRPNQFQYGKMVVRNGWYVWRVKYPNPSLIAAFKWHCITLLLSAIRFSNVVTTSDKMKAITEALGRLAGWISLLIKKPKSENG